MQNSSPLLSLSDLGSSNKSRCAACKQLRRRCPSDCIFLPFFPPNDPQRFSLVHRIFGASKVGFMLQQVKDDERADVAESLYYEAQCRVKDPVYGCVGIITHLNDQIRDVQGQLAKVEAQIQVLKARQQVGLRLGTRQPQFHHDSLINSFGLFPDQWVKP
ncbi:unnamed protein product [Cuscuta campestris]|uniref:LOB domain-containing protein n=1 Tax=Cuscuta campestris TaxID=132261 RepID=A0A484LZ88_9ASTE|nr:unnamed protein product [Cuscuta campestris]